MCLQGEGGKDSFHVPVLSPFPTMPTEANFSGLSTPFWKASTWRDTQALPSHLPVAPPYVKLVPCTLQRNQLAVTSLGPQFSLSWKGLKNVQEKSGIIRNAQKLNCVALR